MLELSLDFIELDLKPEKNLRTAMASFDSEILMSTTTMVDYMDSVLEDSRTVVDLISCLWISYEFWE